jgi:hypothetical protein
MTQLVKERVCESFTASLGANPGPSRVALREPFQIQVSCIDSAKEESLVKHPCYLLREVLSASRLSHLNSPFFIRGLEFLFRTGFGGSRLAEQFGYR